MKRPSLLPWLVGGLVFLFLLRSARARAAGQVFAPRTATGGFAYVPPGSGGTGGGGSGETASRGGGSTTNS